MSISKHVDDHNTSGVTQRASATGFVLAQGRIFLENPPLSKDETGPGCSLCNSCGVVIIDILADRHCFLLFHLNRYCSRPELRYLSYPCGSLGGNILCFILIKTDRKKNSHTSSTSQFAP